MLGQQGPMVSFSIKERNPAVKQRREKTSEEKHGHFSMWA